MAVLLSQVLADKSTRGLLGVDQIKQTISKSVNYKNDETPPEQAAAMLIFSTRNQQTWLIATPNRLYCVLDDVRKPETHINWSIGSKSLVDKKGKIKLPVKVRDKTDRTGYVDIGPKHKNWLFTKALFPQNDAVNAISTFISSSITPGAK